GGERVEPRQPGDRRVGPPQRPRRTGVQGEVREPPPVRREVAALWVEPAFQPRSGLVGAARDIPTPDVAPGARATADDGDHGRIGGRDAEESRASVAGRREPTVQACPGARFRVASDSEEGVTRERSKMVRAQLTLVCAAFVALVVTASAGAAGATRLVSPTG